MIAPVKSSFPFWTCSALPPAVMIWIVPASMIASEIAPLIPAAKVRRALVSAPSLDLNGMHPRAVSIPLRQFPSGFQTLLLLARLVEPSAISILKSLHASLSLQQVLVSIPLPL